MYRVGLEAILGFAKRGETVGVDPRVPEGWGEFAVTYRYRTSVYEIVVEQPHRARSGNQEVSLDGRVLDTETIALTDDGQTHRVVVRPKG
jgi:cellobiose phosphorylase